MRFDHIKENFAAYCIGALLAWVIALMALDLAWSGIKTARATFAPEEITQSPQDRNARGCLVRDGIEICEKL